MIKELFKNNLKIKLLSILVAFFMWIFVMAEVDPIINRTIDSVSVTSITNQLEIEEMGLVISPESDVSTQVSVRGRRSLVNNYVSKGASVTGAIKNPKTGINQIDLVILPKDNVELTINPIRTEVILEELASSRKAISTRVTGEPEQGYEVNKITFNPSSTLVEGPKSSVSEVNEVIANIDVTSSNKDFSQNVKLSAIDSKGNEVKNVKLQVRYVEATVEVHKNKIVPIRLTVVDGEEELSLTNYYIDPKEIKTRPITVEQLKEAGDLMVSLDLPEGISSNIISGNLKSDNGSAYPLNLEFSKTDINLDGYTETEKTAIYSILPDKIKVSLVYDKSFENKIQTDDIKMYVDKEKSSTESNRYYFAVESEIPYLRITITPNVVNKIN